MKPNRAGKRLKRAPAQRKSGKKKKSLDPVPKEPESPSSRNEEQGGVAIESLNNRNEGENVTAVDPPSLPETPSIDRSFQVDPVGEHLRDRSDSEESSLSSEAREVASLDGEALELLTFSLGKEEYAIDIKMIQEITKITNITPIPRTPSYIHGIVTLRGNVIPVFNIHDRLKLDPFVEGGKSRFVICQLKEGAAAITVDAVTDVVHLKRSLLEPPPSSVAADGGGFIKNIGRFKERLLILLDLQKTLQIDSSQVQ